MRKKDKLVQFISEYEIRHIEVDTLRWEDDSWMGGRHKYRRAISLTKREEEKERGGREGGGGGTPKTRELSWT